MIKMFFDKTVAAQDFDRLNEALHDNPAWQKVRRFSVLQDIFLCISLGSAIIHIIFDSDHPFWAIVFLLAGILSLVFGRFSMNIFREYFVSKSDLTKEASGIISFIRK